MPFLTKPLPRSAVKEELPSSFRFDFLEERTKQRVIVIEDPPKKFRAAMSTGDNFSPGERIFRIAKPWSYMVFSVPDFRSSGHPIRNAIVFFSQERVKEADSEQLCYAPLPNMRYTRIWHMSVGICMGDVRPQSYGSLQSRMKSFHDMFWNSPFTMEVPASKGVIPSWMGKSTRGWLSKFEAWERRSRRPGRMLWKKASASMDSIKKAGKWFSEWQYL